jgi:mitogen-activated protein kinase kinase
MKRKNVKGLALTPAAPRPPPTAETSRRGSDFNKDDGGKEEQLEIGIEYKLDLRPEELEVMKELGSGNGGTVSKVRHLTTGTVMARKVRSTTPVVPESSLGHLCCNLQTNSTHR